VEADQSQDLEARPCACRRLRPPRAGVWIDRPRSWTTRVRRCRRRKAVVTRLTPSYGGRRRIQPGFRGDGQKTRRSRRSEPRVDGQAAHLLAARTRGEASVPEPRAGSLSVATGRGRWCPNRRDGGHGDRGTENVREVVVPSFSSTRQPRPSSTPARVQRSATSTLRRGTSPRTPRGRR
jgi:hypothetical protein